MKKFPNPTGSPVVRTDFSNNAIYTKLKEQMANTKIPGFNIPGFALNLQWIEDRAYQDLAIEQLLDIIPQDYPISYLMVVDRVTIESPDHPVLVVDLMVTRGRSFRALPSAIWLIESNLSIANMDFDEFADATNESGIFRGFEDA